VRHRRRAVGQRAELPGRAVAEIDLRLGDRQRTGRAAGVERKGDRLILAGVTVTDTEGAVSTDTVTVAVAPPTVAVTVASRAVVSVTRASPLLSVCAVPADSCPAVVVNATVAPGNGLPATSRTSATTCAVPPLGPMRAGSARSVTVSAAAEPTGSSSVALDAAPENAVMVAVPDRPSPVKRTVTLPFCVRASDGSIRPRVVVKLTTVPFCTGVPACSTTVATMSVEPVDATEVDVANRLMVDSVGAVSGTLSQPANANDIIASAARHVRPARVHRRAIIAKSIKKSCS
jgi:hypothetical protein